MSMIVPEQHQGDTATPHPSTRWCARRPSSKRNSHSCAKSQCSPTARSRRSVAARGVHRARVRAVSAIHFVSLKPEGSQRYGESTGDLLQRRHGRGAARSRDLLAIKDGDSLVGYAIEKGNWDADEERWTGEWRQDCANASQSEASNWFHRPSIGIREPRR